MMEVKFDVSQIDMIKLTKRKMKPFLWLEAFPGKYAFWPWNSEKAYSAGFYYGGYIKGDYYTEETAKKAGCIVDKDGPSPILYDKPKVEVVMRHTDNVYKTFNSEQKAEAWVKKLEEMSGKTFETITY